MIILLKVRNSQGTAHPRRIFNAIVTADHPSSRGTPRTNRRRALPLSPLPGKSALQLHSPTSLLSLILSCNTGFPFDLRRTSSSRNHVSLQSSLACLCPFASNATTGVPSTSMAKTGCCLSITISPLTEPHRFDSRPSGA